ncbi:FAHD2, partial [Symbiodinium microadriaticum]
VTPSGSEPFVSQRITITQNTVKQASYRTREFAGMFCVPHFDEDQEILGDDPLVESLLDDYGPIGNSYYRMAAAFGGLRRSWRMVLGAVVFSVFLSYLYLLLLRIAPYPTAIVSLALVMLATFLLSIYFLLGEVLSGDWKVSYQNNNSFYKLFATSYAAWVSRIVGILLLGMFFFM